MTFTLKDLTIAKDRALAYLDSYRKGNGHDINLLKLNNWTHENDVITLQMSQSDPTHIAIDFEYDYDVIDYSEKIRLLQLCKSWSCSWWIHLQNDSWKKFDIDQLFNLKYYDKTNDAYEIWIFSNICDLYNLNIAIICEKKKSGTRLTVDDAVASSNSKSKLSKFNSTSGMDKQWRCSIQIWSYINCDPDSFTRQQNVLAIENSIYRLFEYHDCLYPYFAPRIRNIYKLEDSLKDLIISDIRRIVMYYLNLDQHIN